MSSYFPYALSQQEMQSLPESVRNEILRCIRERYSQPIQPIRDENGNIALGPSESTGGYYASASYESSPPGSPSFGGVNTASGPAPRQASEDPFARRPPPLQRSYTDGGLWYSSGVPPLARTMTGGAYASISRLAREGSEDDGSAAGGAPVTPPGYDYGPSVPLPRTVDWAAVRIAEESERLWRLQNESAASGGGASGGGASVPMESSGGIVLTSGYEHISPALISRAEELLDKAIDQNEKFGATSKTNIMSLDAFHFMRDNGIEHYPPLYPKKKKIMSIISYTDLGY